MTAVAAMSGTAPQIYAVPFGAVPGLAAVQPGSAAVPSPANNHNNNNSNSNNNNNNSNINNNNNNSNNNGTATSAASTNTANNTNATALNTSTGSESAAMTGVNMSPDNTLTTGLTPPLISLSAGASPVLSPGSVKYSPKEFLPFTEEDTHTGLTPPLMLASPTSIGSASSPLGIDHVFALPSNTGLPKSKKRKLDEISSPNEDSHRPFGAEEGSVMTSHVIPLSTNHVTKQQQQDDAIMTTLSSALGASQGTGSALTPVFALTAAASDEDEASTTTAGSHNTSTDNATGSSTAHSALTSSGPKKKDLKITIPSHGLFVAPYPVMLAPPLPQESAAGSSDTSKSGNNTTAALPTAGPATPGVFMPPMTPHLVTPLGANFEFPQFFLPQSPFVQSPLMTPTFAPFYSFMPSTPKT